MLFRRLADISISRLRLSKPAMVGLTPTSNAGSFRNPKVSRFARALGGAGRPAGQHYRTLPGRPEQFWRLCDANRAMRPED